MSAMYDVIFEVSDVLMDYPDGLLHTGTHSIGLTEKGGPGVSRGPAPHKHKLIQLVTDMVAC